MELLGGLLVLGVMAYVGLSICAVMRVEGRGIDGPPPASALLHRLRRRTVLRRTIDPSPSSVFCGAEHHPPGLEGGFGAWVGQRFARLRRTGAQPCQLEEGFTVPRRTVCGEAVERSAGRSGIVDPSSTHE